MSKYISLLTDFVKVSNLVSTVSVLFVCPFDYTAVAGSGKVGP